MRIYLILITDRNKILYDLLFISIAKKKQKHFIEVWNSASQQQPPWD